MLRVLRTAFIMHFASAATWNKIWAPVHEREKKPRHLEAAVAVAQCRQILKPIIREVRHHLHDLQVKGRLHRELLVDGVPEESLGLSIWQTLRFELVSDVTPLR